MNQDLPCVLNGTSPASLKKPRTKTEMYSIVWQTKVISLSSIVHCPLSIVHCPLSLLLAPCSLLLAPCSIIAKSHKGTTFFLSMQALPPFSPIYSLPLTHILPSFLPPLASCLLFSSLSSFLSLPAKRPRCGLAKPAPSPRLVYPPFRYPRSRPHPRSVPAAGLPSPLPS